MIPLVAVVIAKLKSSLCVYNNTNCSGNGSNRAYAGRTVYIAYTMNTGCGVNSNAEFSVYGYSGNTCCSDGSEGSSTANVGFSVHEYSGNTGCNGNW